MLEVRNLECKLGPDWRLECSFSIPNSRWLSIIGPSGSGKSTLVKCLAGFTTLSEGEIILNGSSVHHLEPATRGFAIVFQNDTLFHHLTIRQNLMLALHDSTDPRKVRTEKARNIIDHVMLPETTFDKYPHQLSGGQRARVSVARALLRGSKWLILDESFASLDEKLRIELDFWLESLKEKDGLGIVAVTHNQNEARMFSDWILALVEGKLVYSGPPSGLDESLTHSGAYRFFSTDQARIDLGDQVVSLPSDQVSVHPLNSETLALTESGFKVLPVPRARVVKLSGGMWTLREQGRSTLVPMLHRPPQTPLALVFPDVTQDSKAQTGVKPS